VIDKNKSFIKHVPNILTTGRLVLTGFFLWMILVSDNISNRTRFIDIAFVFFIITGLTDIVDGYIARRFDATSKYGRIVDPLADKILICGAYICFAVIGRPLLFGWSQTTLSFIHWGVVAVLIFRELAVTIIRQWSENRNFKFPASVYGKLKMFTQSFGVGTILVKMAHAETAQWAYWFTAVTLSIMILATLVSGFEAVLRMFIAVKNSKQSAMPSA
jgi:CDP-diacylglycerol---glycerol-3-phosphate 3-phosphatidyltransferase